LSNNLKDLDFSRVRDSVKEDTKRVIEMKGGHVTTFSNNKYRDKNLNKLCSFPVACNQVSHDTNKIVYISKTVFFDLCLARLFYSV